MFGFGNKQAHGSQNPPGALKQKSAATTQELTAAEMSKLDFILVVDHSGSMGNGSNRIAGTRTDEIKETVVRMAKEAEKYDDDGITVIGFSDEARVFDGVGSLKVASVFKDFPPQASTNLAAALSAAVAKASSSKKETVVLVFTDGSPNDRDAATRVIDTVGRKLGRPRIGFTFIQVGRDPGAAEFLAHLDNEMKVDVCATLREDEAENMTLGKLCWLARNA